MKKLLWIFASAMLLSNLFLSTGCGTDDPVITTAPTTTIESSDEVTVLEGAEFTVTVKVAKGSGTLTELAIQQDAVNIDLDQVVDVNNQGGGAVRNTVPTADADGFTWDIVLKAPATAGDYVISFVATDANGKTSSADVGLTVETGITKTLTAKLLYNQGGGVGKGALDLDEGLSTGVASTGQTTPDQAEIRDCGIDSTSMTSQSWRMQITYVNGTDLRYVGQSTPESTFDDINSEEAITRIFNAATPVSAEPITGDGTGTSTWGSYKVSEVVKEGDIFAAQKAGGTRTYLFRVEKVNVTNNNNEDNYELTIKY